MEPRHYPSEEMCRSLLWQVGNSPGDKAHDTDRIRSARALSAHLHGEELTEKGGQGQCWSSQPRSGMRLLKTAGGRPAHHTHKHPLSSVSPGPGPVLGGGGHDRGPHSHSHL